MRYIFITSPVTCVDVDTRSLCHTGSPKALDTSPTGTALTWAFAPDIVKLGRDNKARGARQRHVDRSLYEVLEDCFTRLSHIRSSPAGAIVYWNHLLQNEHAAYKSLLKLDIGGRYVQCTLTLHILIHSIFTISYKCIAGRGSKSAIFISKYYSSFLAGLWHQPSNVSYSILRLW